MTTDDHQQLSTTISHIVTYLRATFWETLKTVRYFFISSMGTHSKAAEKSCKSGKPAVFVTKPLKIETKQIVQREKKLLLVGHDDDDPRPVYNKNTQHTTHGLTAAYSTAYYYNTTTKAYSRIRVFVEKVM